MGEFRTDLPAVHGETQRASLPTRAEGSLSSFLASSCQLSGSKNAGVGVTELCAVRKVISLKNPAKTIVPI